MCVHVMLIKIINVKRCVGLCMFVCVCVCKHSRMVSFVLLFPTMCEYCPPTNRCDHVRPVARGDSRGSTKSPLGGGGGGRGEGRKKKKIIIFLSASTHGHTTKSQSVSQSVRILPCSVLKCIRLSGALHDCLLL